MSSHIAQDQNRKLTKTKNNEKYTYYRSRIDSHALLLVAFTMQLEQFMGISI